MLYFMCSLVIIASEGNVITSYNFALSFNASEDHENNSQQSLCKHSTLHYMPAPYLSSTRHMCLLFQIIALAQRRLPYVRVTSETDK